jgi:hypothetical protein
MPNVGPEQVEAELMLPRSIGSQLRGVERWAWTRRSRSDGPKSPKVCARSCRVRPSVLKPGPFSGAQAVGWNDRR